MVAYIGLSSHSAWERMFIHVETVLSGKTDGFAAGYRLLNGTSILFAARSGQSELKKYIMIIIISTNKAKKVRHW